MTDTTDSKDATESSDKQDRTFDGSIAILVFAVCAGTFVAFSIINRHWFGLFGQLDQLKNFHFRAFDLHGVWSMLAVGAGVCVISVFLTPLIIGRPPPFVERALWASIFAITIAGVSTAVLAIFGELYAGTLLLALALVAAATLARAIGRGSLFSTLDWWRSPSELSFLGASWSGTRPWRWICVGYLALMAFVLIFHSITTPITDYDALIYHAAMAKILVHSHGMPLITGPSPGIEMSGNYPPLFPALGAFTLIFAHGNDIFLRALAPLGAIGTAAVAYAIARRFGGTMLGLLAAVFTLTAQIVSLYAVYDTVYTFMGLFAAMAFLALITNVSDKSVVALILVGLSLGLLFFCSYQAVIYLAWLPFIVWYLWRTVGRRRAVVGTAAIAAPLVFVGGFWYVRNWVVLGNPVYPWYYHIFGGRGLASPLRSLAQASVTNVAQSLAYTAQGPSKVLDLLGILFFNRNFFPVLSPIAVLGFVLAIRASTKGSRERIALWLLIPCAVLPILLFIANGTFFFRYFIPAIPILAVLPAYAFRHLALAVPRHRLVSGLNRKAAMTMLLYTLVFPGTFVLLAGSYYYEYYDFQPQRTFLASWTSLNPKPAQEAIASDYGGDESFVWIQDHLSPGARVATYESRLYYLFNANFRRILFLDGNGVDPIWNQKNPQTVARYLRKKGVQYLWLSNIVEAGSSHLPLVRDMAGNSPEFPEVWQSYDDIVYGVGRMRLRIGESADVTMSNAAMWSRVVSVDGAPARAVLSPDPGPANHPDPASVLVANGRNPGLVSFQYLTPKHVTNQSTLAVDISSNRNWTATTPNSWQRLLTTPLVGPGTWHTGFVWITANQPLETARLGFRSSDGPVFVRRITFTPMPRPAANITLEGSWNVAKIGGQVYFVGRRSTNPVAVQQIYSDVIVSLSRHGAPYVDVHYRDGTGVVNVSEKVGTQGVLIGSILEGGTGQQLTQRLPLDPSVVKNGSVYLIFDTQGSLFALSSINQAASPPQGDNWEPIAFAYEGNWKAADVDGTVAAIAHRGGKDYTDLLIPDQTTLTPQRWRLAYLDVRSATLIVSAVDSQGKWHVLATVHTTGSDQVRYVDLTAAQRYNVAGGGHYVVLDTRNTSVPILGVQSETIP